MEVPTREQLMDADLREQFLADVMLAVLAGEIKSKDANCLKGISKEMRDNMNLRALTREIDVTRRLVREVLARNTGLSVDEVDAIYRKVAEEVRTAAEGEGE